MLRCRRLLRFRLLNPRTRSMLQAHGRIAALTLAGSLLMAGAAGASTTTPATDRHSPTMLGRGDRVVAPASLYEALAKIHEKVPPFSRQTGLACSSCHYQFPHLTPFG